MNCIRCGVQTETGCSHDECPHTNLYQQIVCTQGEKLVPNELFWETVSQEDMIQLQQQNNEHATSIESVNSIKGGAVNTIDDLNEEELPEDHW